MAGIYIVNNDAGGTDNIEFYTQKDDGTATLTLSVGNGETTGANDDTYIQGFQHDRDYMDFYTNGALTMRVRADIGSIPSFNDTCWIRSKVDADPAQMQFYASGSIALLLSQGF